MLIFIKCILDQIHEVRLFNLFKTILFDSVYVFIFWFICFPFYLFHWSIFHFSFLLSGFSFFYFCFLLFAFFDFSEQNISANCYSIVIFYFVYIVLLPLAPVHVSVQSLPLLVFVIYYLLSNLAVWSLTS